LTTRKNGKRTTNALVTLRGQAPREMNQRDIAAAVASMTEDEPGVPR